jgi:hypothetical protein
MRRNLSLLSPVHLLVALGLLFAVVSLGLPSRALDLGDLDVPAGRLMLPNGESRWQPPHEPADTSSGWNTHIVTGCNLGDNATDDEVCVDNAVAAAAADPNPVIVYFPAGTYNFTTNQTIAVRRSNMILRCEDPATTHLKFHAGQESFCPQNSSTNICFGGSNTDGADVAWTGGFNENTTVLTVANTSGFAVGDWVRAHMNQSTGCYDGYMNNNSYDHYAKVVSKTGSTITLDRPLRMDYAGDPDCAAGSTTYVRKVTMIEQVGIENCHVEHTLPTCTSSRYEPATAFERVANGWVTGSHYQNWCNVSIRARGSAGILVSSSKFEDLYEIGSSNSQGIDNQRTTDTYVINNVFERVRVGSECQDGAEGVVFAHNYQVPGFYDRERSFFLHGEYCRENLIEANYSDAAPQPDSHWGRQGPRNTWYRNRHYSDSPVEWPKAVYFSTHKDRGPIIADQLTWIANHVNWMVGGPPFPIPPPADPIPYNDVDKYTTNFWLEKNVTEAFVNVLSPEPTTDCGTGTGPGGCSEGPANFIGDNYQRATAAPAEWSGVTIPDSLYLAGVPDWWCQEACPFGQAGIGALGDDASGPLCKLPAQIREEGGACTPMGSSPPPDPPDPPYPPVLLSPEE